MRNVFRTMISTFILVLMFSIFGVSVFAASETLTSYRYAEFRGNGSYSGKGVAGERIEIGADETVKFTSRLEMTVDPNTEGYDVSVYVALRRETIFGYSTLMSSNLYGGSSMDNTGENFITYVRESTATGTTDATGNYFVYARTSGASVAFYSDFTFVVQYTATS